jgi:hypothetical protein
LFLAAGTVAIHWRAGSGLKLIMLGTLGTHVLMKKKEQMSLPDESNFDPQLSQLLQLLNP